MVIKEKFDNESCGSMERGDIVQEMSESGYEKSMMRRCSLNNQITLTSNSRNAPVNSFNV